MRRPLQSSRSTCRARRSATWIRPKAAGRRATSEPPADLDGQPVSVLLLIDLGRGPTPILNRSTSYAGGAGHSRRPPQGIQGPSIALPLKAIPPSASGPTGHRSGESHEVV